MKQKQKRYERLRAKLVEQGSSLRDWARRNGYNPRTVYNAAKGERRGAKSAEIARRLKEEVV